MAQFALPTLIQALLKAEAYPHPVDNIELHETHISWVILTGAYAYKIKKPVDFGFLDFSSLEKRQFNCEEEVRLNRRLAPDIYLDVVPICGERSSAQVNGQGRILEYAVRMVQFDTQAGFDALLARQALTAELMDDTARVLAGFHQTVRRANSRSTYGDADAVYQPVTENFSALQEHLPQQLPEQDILTRFEQLQTWSQQQFSVLKPVFQSRKTEGFIRECHGDLHLRNIIYWQGQVIPFDCIEFNPNLRWIDVMSELAFLVMDLDDHQRPELARRLLNAYLQISGDYAGLRVLRFYQVYRALVRAKVASLRLAQTQDDDEESREELRNYLQLAWRYTQPPRARLLLTYGLSGSGKTTVSQQILEQADVIRLRSDVERKRLHGLAETGHSGAGINEGIYQSAASALVYDHLQTLAAILLQSGYSVLVDAAFLRAEQRQAFEDYAALHDIPLRILHCRLDESVQRQRLRERSRLADDASEAGIEVLDHQLQTAQSLSAEEERISFTLDTTQQTDISEVIAWLNEN